MPSGATSGAKVKTLQNDAFYLVKRLIRNTKNLDEALNELTIIGLETDTRAIFDFTERLRGFLCARERRELEQGSRIPRREGREEGHKLQEEVDGDAVASETSEG